MANSMSAFEHCVGEGKLPTPGGDIDFDWTHVRPAYRRLYAEFWQLARPFGIPLSPELFWDLALVIAAMDAVDRELDKLKDLQSRKQLSRQVVTFLAGDIPRRYESLPMPNLEKRLLELGEMVIQRNIQVPFVETIQSIFNLSEEKRQAHHVSKFADCIRQEWRLAGMLPLFVLGPVATPKFRDFFLSLCETMHVIDTVIDAPSDYREGTLSFRPGPKLYLTLAIFFAKQVWKLLVIHPAPLYLVRYAFAVATSLGHSPERSMLVIDGVLLNRCRQYESE